MIHTARQSPKFLRLVRKLRPLVGHESIVDAESVAVSILERLWHAAIAGAKRGDIGRYEDDVIAEMVGWMGEPEQLVGMLVESGWLEPCETHRLVVSDWPRIRLSYPSGEKRSRPDLDTPQWKRRRKEVIRRSGTVCKYCGCDCGDFPTIDHVIPVALGGTNDMENLVVACRSCNSRKGAKLI